MSHDRKAVIDTLFKFFMPIAFSMLFVTGLLSAYFNSFLPDRNAGDFLWAMLLSASVVSLCSLIKKGGYVILIFFGTIAACVLFMLKNFIESAGDTFLPLYAAFHNRTDMLETYYFKVSASFFIVVFTLVMTGLSVLVITKKLPAIFSLMFGFIVIVLCALYSYTPLSAGPFMLLVGSMVIILIERRGLLHTGAGAPVPAVYAVIPLLILSLILNAFIRPSTYVQSPSAEKLRLSIEDFILDHTDFYVDVDTGNLLFGKGAVINRYSWMRNEEYANVDSGALIRNTKEAFRIEPPETYPHYIKLNEFTYYDGRGWKRGNTTEEMSIDVVYTTVPPETREALDDIAEEISKNNGALQKALDVSLNQWLMDALAAGEDPYNSFRINNGDLQIPDWVIEDHYRRMIGSQFDKNIIAESIRDYVLHCGTYERNISAPPDYADVADWFLHVTHKGYCIHFATAACLLLRMNGIPAKFVTGFLVNERAPEKDGLIKVTENDAHAWVEYYADGEWKLMEATPPDPAAVSSAGGSTYGPSSINDRTTYENIDVDDSEDEEDDEDDEDSGDEKDDTASSKREDNSKMLSEFEMEKQKKLNAALTALIVLALLAGISILSIFLVKLFYRRYLLKGTNKARILKYYRAAKLRRKSFSKKTDIPENVAETVLKARFSDHDMSDSELKLLIDYYESISRDAS